MAAKKVKARRSEVRRVPCKKHVWGQVLCSPRSKLLGFVIEHSPRWENSCKRCGESSLSSVQVQVQELEASVTLLVKPVVVSGAVLRYARHALGFSLPMLARLLNYPEKELAADEMKEVAPVTLRLALAALCSLHGEGQVLMSTRSKRIKAWT